MLGSVSLVVHIIQFRFAAHTENEHQHNTNLHLIRHKQLLNCTLAQHTGIEQTATTC